MFVGRCALKFEVLLISFILIRPKIIAHLGVSCVKSCFWKWPFRKTANQKIAIREHLIFIDFNLDSQADFWCCPDSLSKNG